MRNSGLRVLQWRKGHGGVWLSALVACWRCRERGGGHLKLTAWLDRSLAGHSRAELANRGVAFCSCAPSAQTLT